MYLNKKALVADIANKVKDLDKAGDAKRAVNEMHVVLWNARLLSKYYKHEESVSRLRKGGKIDLGNGIVARYRKYDESEKKFKEMDESGKEVAVKDFIKDYKAFTPVELEQCVNLATRRALAEVALKRRKKGDRLGSISDFCDFAVGVILLLVFALAATALTINLLVRFGKITLTRAIKLTQTVLEGLDVALAALVLALTLVVLTVSIMKYYNDKTLKEYTSLENALAKRRLENFKEYRDYVTSQTNFDNFTSAGKNSIDIVSAALLLAAQTGEFVLALKGSKPIYLLGINIFSFMVMAGLLMYVIHKVYGSFHSAKTAAYDTEMPRSKKTLLIVLVMAGLVSGVLSIVSMAFAIGAAFSKDLKVPFGITLGFKVAGLLSLIIFAVLLITATLYKPKDRFVSKLDRLLSAGDKTATSPNRGILSTDDVEDVNKYGNSEIGRYFVENLKSDLDASLEKDMTLAQIASDDVLLDTMATVDSVCLGLPAMLEQAAKNVSTGKDGEQFDFDYLATKDGKNLLTRAMYYNTAMINNVLENDGKGLFGSSAKNYAQSLVTGIKTSRGDTLVISRDSLKEALTDELIINALNEMVSEAVTQRAVGAVPASSEDWAIRGKSYRNFSKVLFVSLFQNVLPESGVIKLVTDPANPDGSVVANGTFTDRLDTPEDVQAVNAVMSYLILSVVAPVVRSSLAMVTAGYNSTKDVLESKTEDEVNALAVSEENSSQQAEKVLNAVRERSRKEKGAEQYSGKSSIEGLADVQGADVVQDLLNDVVVRRESLTKVMENTHCIECEAGYKKVGYDGVFNPLKAPPTFLFANSAGTIDGVDKSSVFKLEAGLGEDGNVTIAQSVVAEGKPNHLLSLIQKTGSKDAVLIDGSNNTCVVSGFAL